MLSYLGTDDEYVIIVVYNIPYPIFQFFGNGIAYVPSTDPNVDIVGKPFVSNFELRCYSLVLHKVHTSLCLAVLINFQFSPSMYCTHSSSSL